MGKPAVFLFFAVALITAAAPYINAEEGGSLVPSVKFSLGTVIGVISAETEAYKWSGDRYNYAYGGSSVLFNWFCPTFNVMLLFSSLKNGFCFGFGADITVALFGRFFSREDFSHNHPITGGTLAPYMIMGYKKFLLHTGFDFGTGSFYVSPNYIINRHLMIGIKMSPFGNNHHGLYNVLMLPAEKVNPPDPYWEDKFLQIGLSVQYVF